MVGVRGGCPEGARCPRSQVEELRRFVRCAPRFFVLSPPRAALPDSSSARRIFKDTRAVPFPSDPRVVVRLGESRSS